MKRVVGSIVVIASFLLNSSVYVDNDYDEYEMTKYQVTEILNYYMETFTEEILDHKYMEKEIKAELVLGYYKLKEEDREPYIEFIRHVISGGIPKAFSESERYEFNSDDDIDLYKLIIVNDPEDGEIILNSDNTIIDTDLNKDVSGIYEVKYTISDSDNNIINYSIYIIINKIDNDNNDDNTIEVTDDIKEDNNTEESNEIKENNIIEDNYENSDNEKVVIDKKEDSLKPSVPSTGI